MPTPVPYGNRWSFRYTDETGKQRRVTRATEPEALAECREIYKRLVTGEPTVTEDLTFREAQDLWRESPRGAGAGTWKLWTGILDNHLVPAFGNVSCQTLMNPSVKDRDHLNRYFDRKTGKAAGMLPPVSDAPGVKQILSIQSAHHHHQLLSLIFSFVEERTQGALRNPMGRVKLDKIPRPKNPTLTEDEACAILELIEPDYKAPILLMLALGLRLGEVFGLLLTDHDAQAFPGTGEGLLTLRRQLKLDWSQEEPGQIAYMLGSPKTDTSEHDYKISAVLNRALTAHRALTADRPNPQGLLFPTTGVKGLESKSNFHQRHWTPAVVGMQLKRLDDDELAQLSATIEASAALLAALVAEAPMLSLRTAAALTWQSLDTGTVEFLDTDGVLRAQPLSDTLCARLDAHRDHQLSEGLPNKHDLIFRGPNRRSSPIRFDETIRALVCALEKMGLRPTITPHSCRHTFASILIASGKSLAEVSDLLRHARKSTTADLYVHLLRRRYLVSADITERFAGRDR